MDGTAAGVWFAPQEVSFAESHPLSVCDKPACCTVSTDYSWIYAQAVKPYCRSTHSGMTDPQPFCEDV